MNYLLKVDFNLAANAAFQRILVTLLVVGIWFLSRLYVLKIMNPLRPISLFSKICLYFVPLTCTVALSVYTASSDQQWLVNFLTNGSAGLFGVYCGITIIQNMTPTEREQAARQRDWDKYRRDTSESDEGGYY